MPGSVLSRQGGDLKLQLSGSGRIVDASRAKSVLQSNDETSETPATSSTKPSLGAAPNTASKAVDRPGPAPNSKASGSDQRAASRKRPKFSRSTKGCLGCRKQKVKCDETRPSCLRCIGAERDCVWPTEGGRKRRPRGSAGPGKTSGNRGSNAHGGNQNGRNGSRDASEGGGGREDSQTRSQSQSESEEEESENENEDIKDIDVGDILSGINFDSYLPTGMPGPSSQPISHSVVQSQNVLPPLSASGLQPVSFGNSTLQPRLSPTNVILPRLTSQLPPPDPPHLVDLNRSSLLNKRKDKARASTAYQKGQAAPYVQQNDFDGNTQMRLAMVESILHAFAFDDSLFEFGPSHRTRNMIQNLSTPLNTDILSLAFPSPVARLLFHFYCNTTSRILITMGNIGPNPLLSLCTPLKLLDTASAWAGAIRMSILSISASHFAHETEESVGLETLGKDWGSKKRKLKELSRKFKKAALCNVYLGTGSDDPYQVDSILAACVLLCIRDVIDADTTWQDNLDFALHLISKKGGPQAVLKSPDSSFTRRYLLENLAVHDVFGCFITGKEPALLGNFDPWWFDSVETSTTRWEWESVEQTFGISRTVVDLLARIAVLDSRKRRLEINMSAKSEEMGDVGQYIMKESQNLLFELDILGNSLAALPQHTRVTCGDYTYKYMASVFVLADILEQPITSSRVIQDVASILELCSEASAMRMPVMLIWPLLIAGVFCLPEHRSKVRELFEVFDPYYCEDIRAARELLEEQWRGIDRGGRKRSWKEVMEVTGRKVLLIW